MDFGLIVLMRFYVNLILGLKGVAVPGTAGPQRGKASWLVQSRRLAAIDLLHFFSDSEEEEEEGEEAGVADNEDDDTQKLLELAGQYTRPTHILLDILIAMQFSARYMKSTWEFIWHIWIAHTYAVQL